MSFTSAHRLQRGVYGLLFLTIKKKFIYPLKTYDAHVAARLHREAYYHLFYSSLNLPTRYNRAGAEELRHNAAIKRIRLMVLNFVLIILFFNFSKTDYFSYQRPNRF